MASVEKRTVSLPAEQASYIDGLVASGTYATASEVVRAGLRALQERDAAVERWLREEVTAGHAEYLADPSKGVPAEQILDRIKARRAAVRSR
ncbi:type II toxin-antitoxin system ParD family antitoxin [Roseococcus sp. SYP-B2431]|uniref:type II toxin-antitoxin system ParD family antitoxin n=1 Tax=Roseococcus sp. SYP-B2431 TaxID=2496640 RepID=UPI0010396932|nr:type II toxin-antitoxin system ParD family antitoxin [Roseococcus sp. SYP-B2431]TCH96595.1 type II toxin-antitoxin system ParD family antitoxin [Roseococcus sp. SYP-B2431]